jgi:predicted ribosome quality control (RQC) complex YloA/Tae2 family protein
MGKDKYENEELIKYGLPIDIWFHVDNLSSAHVYLRLAEGYTIDTIPEETLNECLQLVKENSIEGCKKDKVSIVYTPWENLLKKSSMEIGQVGFKSDKAVITVHNISKVKDVLKRIEKTMEVKTIDLEAEKEAFMKELSNKRKKLYEDMVIILLYN